MSEQGRARSGSRPVPVAWLDPVAASPIEVAAGGVLVTGLGLLGMVWGAAEASAWLVNGERAGIGVSDAALAMARFGTNGLEWDGAWSPAVERSLAGPGWFWLLFAIEAAIVALLFWPAWRLFGPRPADPMAVVIEQTPAKHPRAEQRRVAGEATSRIRRLVPVAEVVGPAPRLTPTIDKILTAEPTGHEVVLGHSGRRLVATEGCGSVIVFGPTQSGKTSAITIPAVMDWRGPAVVVTAKPDLISATWRPRADLGEVWLFDPVSSMAGGEAIGTASRPRGPASHGWSPLHLIETVARPRNEPELDRRVQQWGLAQRTAGWMTGAVLQQHPETRSGGAALVAERMLAAMLLAATTEERPIGTVGTWADRQDVEAVSEAIERSEVVEAAAAWEGAHRADPAAAIAAFQILADVLAPYRDPRVSALTAQPDISARALLEGDANTLFVLAAPNHRRRLRPLLTTLLSEMLDAAIGQATGSPAGRLRPPLLIVLDDAASSAPLDLLDELASAGAGLGIQLISVFQDLGSIERAFGAGRAVPLANDHQATVVLPGVSDAATLDHVNRLISGSRLRGSQDPVDDGRPSADPLVIGSPTWMRTLADGDALCVYGNLPPVRISLRPWFTDRSLRHRIEPPAPTERRWLFRRRARRTLVGGGFPNPLDSDANDREANRYWESIAADGTLPAARPFDDGTSLGQR